MFFIEFALRAFSADEQRRGGAISLSRFCR